MSFNIIVKVIKVKVKVKVKVVKVIKVGKLVNTVLMHMKINIDPSDSVNDRERRRLEKENGK